MNVDAYTYIDICTERDKQNRDVYVELCTHIYVYRCICIHMYIHIYIYLQNRLSWECAFEWFGECFL